MMEIANLVHLNAELAFLALDAHLALPVLQRKKTLFQPPADLNVLHATLLAKLA